MRDRRFVRLALITVFRNEENPSEPPRFTLRAYVSYGNGDSNFEGRMIQSQRKLRLVLSRLPSAQDLLKRRDEDVKAHCILVSDILDFVFFVAREVVECARF